MPFITNAIKLLNIFDTSHQWEWCPIIEVVITHHNFTNRNGPILTQGWYHIIFEFRNERIPFAKHDVIFKNCTAPKIHSLHANLKWLRWKAKFKPKALNVNFLALVKISRKYYVKKKLLDNLFYCIISKVASYIFNNAFFLGLWLKLWRNWESNLCGLKLGLQPFEPVKRLKFRRLCFCQALCKTFLAI